jgi:hypothetical protein
MPLSVAQYLRHLAVRSARLARDCYDPAVTKELEIISSELVEKAEYLETQFRMPDASDDTGDLDTVRIVSTVDDGTV